MESGRSVIVDKPAFLDFEQAERLVEMSRNQGLCPAGATVYTRHPQMERIRQLFDGAGPTRMLVAFSFPALNDGNFRHRKTLGGGALNDLGPYAVSPGRLFFGARPDEIECRVLSTGGPEDIETAFSVLMRYPGGCSMVSHFGFTTAYRNRLSLLGPDLCVDVDRVFTTPEDLQNELRMSQQSGESTVTAQAANCFVLFVQEVVASIRTQDLEGLREELLDDAFVFDALRRSAGGS